MCVSVTFYLSTSFCLLCILFIFIYVIVCLVIDINVNVLVYIHIQGSHLREKTAFFTQKKSRLRKYENAVCLLYVKNSDLTHQNAFSLFVFCTHQRRFVEHLLWV